jgi:hypothetical protein
MKPEFTMNRLFTFYIGRDSATLGPRSLADVSAAIREALPAFGFLGWTVSLARGFWEGKGEPTVRLEVITETDSIGPRGCDERRPVAVQAHAAASVLAEILGQSSVLLTSTGLYGSTFVGPDDDRSAACAGDGVPLDPEEEAEARAEGEAIAADLTAPDGLEAPISAFALANPEAQQLERCDVCGRSVGQRYGTLFRADDGVSLVKRDACAACAARAAQRIVPEEEAIAEALTAPDPLEISSAAVALEAEAEAEPIASVPVLPNIAGSLRDVACRLDTLAIRADGTVRSTAWARSVQLEAALLRALAEQLALPR